MASPSTSLMRSLATSSSVRSAGVDPHELKTRLRQLRDQLRAREDLLGAEAHEYRFGHTPPLVKQHRQTQFGDATEWLEAATPSNSSSTSTRVASTTLSDRVSNTSHASPHSLDSHALSMHGTRTTVSRIPALNPAQATCYPRTVAEPLHISTGNRKRQSDGQDTNRKAFASKSPRVNDV
ncbi:hypothetical protein NX059_007640 [Plenodomus lindquistii]|nr:hypothetical protein NX059_007640 [Plenodomus lindquistii]